jgi:chitinase
MIAYTPEKVALINQTVDFVNVMTYDLMNRRDNTTNHHTSLNGSLQTIQTYIERGMAPAKMNLGFAFYAKWFTTVEGAACEQPIGCPTVLLENADGSDTGMSGAMTFQGVNFLPVPDPSTLTSGSGTCGAGTQSKCADGACCGQYGYW